MDSISPSFKGNDMKGNWRYIPLTAKQLERIVAVDYETIILDRLDGDDDEEDIGFSIFDLLDSTDLLTDRQKDVLELRLVDALTFEEIGQKLQTSKQNVFEIYNKGIQNLKKDLTWLSVPEVEDDGV
jgi:DNA-directed RNA polymerase specialized sigma subunit